LLLLLAAALGSEERGQTQTWEEPGWLLHNAGPHPEQVHPRQNLENGLVPSALLPRRDN
jgi:hypothetical protein